MELNITNGISCGGASCTDAEGELIWESHGRADEKVIFTLTGDRK